MEQTLPTGKVQSMRELQELMGSQLHAVHNGRVAGKEMASGKISSPGIWR